MLDWITPESWQAFRESRIRLRAPLTPYAEKLIMIELVKLKAAGHDPQECLDQSIRRGWKDVFVPADKGLAKQKAIDNSEFEAIEAHMRAPKADRAKARAAIELARAAIKRVA